MVVGSDVVVMLGRSLGLKAEGGVDGQNWVLKLRRLNFGLHITTTSNQDTYDA